MRYIAVLTAFLLVSGSNWAAAQVERDTKSRTNAGQFSEDMFSGTARDVDPAPRDTQILIEAPLTISERNMALKIAGKLQQMAAELVVLEPLPPTGEPAEATPDMTISVLAQLLDELDMPEPPRPKPAREEFEEVAPAVIEPEPVPAAAELVDEPVEAAAEVETAEPEPIVEDVLPAPVIEDALPEPDEAEPVADEIIEAEPVIPEPLEPEPGLVEPAPVIPLPAEPEPVPEPDLPEPVVPEPAEPEIVPEPEDAPPAARPERIEEEAPEPLETHGFGFELKPSEEDEPAPPSHEPTPRDVTPERAVPEQITPAPEEAPAEPKPAPAPVETEPTPTRDPLLEMRGSRTQREIAEQAGKLLTDMPLIEAVSETLQAEEPLEVIEEPAAAALPQAEEPSAPVAVPQEEPAPQEPEVKAEPQAEPPQPVRREVEEAEPEPEIVSRQDAVARPRHEWRAPRDSAIPPRPEPPKPQPVEEPAAQPEPEPEALPELEPEPQSEPAHEDAPADQPDEPIADAAPVEEAAIADAMSEEPSSVSAPPEEWPDWEPSQRAVPEPTEQPVTEPPADTAPLLDVDEEMPADIAEHADPDAVLSSLDRLADRGAPDFRLDDTSAPAPAVVAPTEPAAALGARATAPSLGSTPSPLLTGRAPLEMSLTAWPPSMPDYEIDSRIKELSRGNTREKVVALTFDDGPHPEYTSQLVAVLEYYDVPATFFFVGVQAQKHPHWVKMVYQGGHEIASQTYDHFRMPKLPHDEKVYQIDEYQRLIEGLTGQTPRFMRPPGGQLDDETRALLAERGMILALWDVALNDTGEYKTSQELLSVSLNRVRSGSVLLAHDGIQATVDMLPELIETLRAQGYEFVTMSELASKSH